MFVKYLAIGDKKKKVMVNGNLPHW